MCATWIVCTASTSTSTRCMGEEEACARVCSAHLCKLKQFVCLIYLAFRTRLPRLSFEKHYFWLTPAMINHGSHLIGVEPLLLLLALASDAIWSVWSFKTNDLNEDWERLKVETENMDCASGNGNGKQLLCGRTIIVVFRSQHNATTVFSII